MINTLIAAGLILVSFSAGYITCGIMTQNIKADNHALEMELRAEKAKNKDKEV